jgi:hypothetical protein
MDACRIPHSGYMRFRRCGVDDSPSSDGEDDACPDACQGACQDAVVGRGAEFGSELRGPERLRRAVTLLLCSVWWGLILIFLILVLCASILFVFEWHFAAE